MQFMLMRGPLLRIRFWPGAGRHWFFWLVLILKPVPTTSMCWCCEATAHNGPLNYRDCSRHCPHRKSLHKPESPMPYPHKVWQSLVSACRATYFGDHVHSVYQWVFPHLNGSMLHLLLQKFPAGNKMLRMKAIMLESKRCYKYLEIIDFKSIALRQKYLTTSPVNLPNWLGYVLMSKQVCYRCCCSCFESKIWEVLRPTFSNWWKPWMASRIVGLRRGCGWLTLNLLNSFRSLTFSERYIQRSLTFVWPMAIAYSIMYQTPIIAGTFWLTIGDWILKTILSFFVSMTCWSGSFFAAADVLQARQWKVWGLIFWGMTLLPWITLCLLTEHCWYIGCVVSFQFL